MENAKKGSIDELEEYTGKIVMTEYQEIVHKTMLEVKAIFKERLENYRIAREVLHEFSLYFLEKKNVIKQFETTELLDDLTKELLNLARVMSNGVVEEDLQEKQPLAFRSKEEQHQTRTKIKQRVIDYTAILFPDFPEGTNTYRTLVETITTVVYERMWNYGIEPKGGLKV